MLARICRDNASQMYSSLQLSSLCPWQTVVLPETNYKPLLKYRDDVLC